MTLSPDQKRCLPFPVLPATDSGLTIPALNSFVCQFIASMMASVSKVVIRSPLASVVHTYGGVKFDP
jgi:hypothetical protein